MHGVIAMDKTKANTSEGAFITCLVSTPKQDLRGRGAQFSIAHFPHRVAQPVAARSREILTASASMALTGFVS
jgi:hypothetical protein